MQMNEFSSPSSLGGKKKQNMTYCSLYVSEVLQTAVHPTREPISFYKLWFIIEL